MPIFAARSHIAFGCSSVSVNIHSHYKFQVEIGVAINRKFYIKIVHNVYTKLCFSTLYCMVIAEPRYQPVKYSICWDYLFMP